MFQVGEMILYGTEGVCCVEAVETPDMPYVEKDRLYYLLRPVSRGGIIYIPVDSGVFMRPLVSKEVALKLIDSIPTIEGEDLESLSQQALNEKYREQLNSHSSEDLIQLIKTVYWKKKKAVGLGRKPSVVDDRMMKRAEDLLHDELSVVLEIPKEEVKDFITQRVGEMEEGWETAGDRE